MSIHDDPARDDTDNARCECGRFIPCRHCPTPIEPADIRPGDVVERRERATVAYVSGSGRPVSDRGYAWGEYGNTHDVTWHLVHRPDPDAEAVEALLAAGDQLPEDIKPGDELRNGQAFLAALREQGWDVTRREAVGYHGKYSVVLDRAKGLATCMNGDPHSEHEWWHTDESGGHMIEERNAGPDDKKWHCPGVTRRQS